MARFIQIFPLIGMIFSPTPVLAAVLVQARDPIRTEWVTLPAKFGAFGRSARWREISITSKIDRIKSQFTLKAARRRHVASRSIA